MFWPTFTCDLVNNFIMSCKMKEMTFVTFCLHYTLSQGATQTRAFVRKFETHLLISLVSLIFSVPKTSKLMSAFYHHAEMHWTCTRRANHQPFIPLLIWCQVDKVDTIIIHQIHITRKLEITKWAFDASSEVLLQTLYVDLHAKPVSLNTFFTQLPTVSIPILREKHQILLKLGAFYHNLLKIHQIHVIWAPSSPMKPTDRYHSKYREIVPEKEDTYRYRPYRVNVRTPPVTYAVTRIKTVVKRKRRRNSGGRKRKEWTFEFDRHHIWSWWTDLKTSSLSSK